MKIKYLIGSILSVFVQLTDAIASDTLPVLNGLMVAGHDQLAALQTTGNVQKWCAVGDTINGFTVKRIDVQGNSIVVSGSDGADKTIVIAAAQVIPDGSARKGTLIGLEQLDWQWIKSDKNPMRKMPETLPEWAIRNWRSLSEDTKLDLRNYYRFHGWDLEVAEKRPGILSGHNERLIDPNAPPPTEAELRERKQNAKSAQPMQQPNPKK